MEIKANIKAITEEMKKAAAYAIADIVTKDKLCPEYIIPSPLDKSVAPAVADAVAKAAEKDFPPGAAQTSSTDIPGSIPKEAMRAAASCTMNEPR